MELTKQEYLLMELAIEYAWQMQEDNTISRAENRHNIVNDISSLVLEDIPDDDLDEFVSKALEC